MNKFFGLGIIFTFGFILSTVGSSASAEMLAVGRVARDIERQYGVQIVYEELPAPVRSKIIFVPAEAADYEVLFKFLVRLDKELAKYPASFYERSQLQAIIIVKRQFYDEKPAEGLYNAEQNIIVMDFMRHHDDEISQQHNIHHELFHMVEMSAPQLWRTKGWESLNKKNFHYGEKKKYQAGQNSVNYYAPAVEGFLSYYGMTTAIEDRAEIFAGLMVKNQYKILHRWAENDVFLARKIAAMKEVVAEYCPEMDEHYWQNLFVQE